MADEALKREAEKSKQKFQKALEDIKSAHKEEMKAFKEQRHQELLDMIANYKKKLKEMSQEKANL